MNKISVTVVVAFFDGSKWIERALESISNQSRPADEVIVVNDGSSASETRFLDSLIKKHKFRILNQENSGQSAARNAGIAAATSDYVCLLDQDDYFLPNHIETLLDAADFEDPKFAFSYGDLWRVTESGQVLAHSCVNLESQHPHTSIKALVGTNMYILPSATLIKKDAFLAIGGFDGNLRGYEDDDLFLRFFVAGYTNRFTPEAVTVWTLNTSSTSFTESMSRSRFHYFQKLVDLFPEGSVVGTRVFGDLLFKRFALQFADDVIASAFQGGAHHAERVERLRQFRVLLKSSEEVGPRKKKRFLFATWPLVTMSSKTLRLFLMFVLKSGVLSVLPGVEGHGDFVRKYLPRKKSLSKTIPVLSENS